MFGKSVPFWVENYLGKPDPRVSKWFLFDSPVWFIGTIILYLSFVNWGTKFMRNRKAFNLKKVLIVYNVFQVCYSFFVAKEVFLGTRNLNFNYLCQPLHLGQDPNTLRMVEAFWYFYFSKYIDLCDTVFLILKKKGNQLSVLHLWHHSSMLFNWYIGVLYLPGGQAYLSVMINSAVHVIMYSYYFLAALGPKVQKYLWWKKYLTQIQLIQFFLIIIHIIGGVIIGCDLPKWLGLFTTVYLFSLIALFLNFYINSYQKSKLKIESVNITVNFAKTKQNGIDIGAGGDKKID